MFIQINNQNNIWKIYNNLALLRLKMNNLIIMMIKIQKYKIYLRLSCRSLAIKQSDRIMITRL